ncbi:hypothetical protein DPMN_037657 [Dreissena polymorpha]|uniref:Uncharacterized protein n=1 Tax=Dreissena polymorpha TaxID=45954 RepID=A0A9D4MDY3_DREPO|nr:hypothetical protein DPMN_037657 [Dreissena polymorpha]
MCLFLTFAYLSPEGDVRFARTAFLLHLVAFCLLCKANVHSLQLLIHTRLL